jgi:hypothetical protein
LQALRDLLWGQELLRCQLHATSDCRATTWVHHDFIPLMLFKILKNVLQQDSIFHPSCAGRNFQTVRCMSKSVKPVSQLKGVFRVPGRPQSFREKMALAVSHPVIQPPGVPIQFVTAPAQNKYQENPKKSDQNSGPVREMHSFLSAYVLACEHQGTLQ